MEVDKRKKPSLVEVCMADLAASLGEDPLSASLTLADLAAIAARLGCKISDLFKPLQSSHRPFSLAASDSPTAAGRGLFEPLDSPRVSTLGRTSLFCVRLSKPFRAAVSGLLNFYVRYRSHARKIFVILHTNRSEPHWNHRLV